MLDLILNNDDAAISELNEQRDQTLHTDDDGFIHQVNICQRSDSTAAKRPALLFCHGGGFHVGSPLGQLSLQRYLAWRFDILVVSTNYPLTGDDRFPRQIQTAANALRWMRKESDSLGINPQQIALMGASAGAYISGMVSATYNNTELAGGNDRYGLSARPARLISLWGPMDFVARWYGNGAAPGAETNLIGGLYTEKPNFYHYASVINHTHPKMPPALFVQGREDPVVHQQQGELGHAAWQEQGIDSELFLVDQIGHGPQSDADRLRVYKKVSDYLAKEFNCIAITGTQDITID